MDLGGVCGRIGTARPTSVWPRAFSTLGRLKRLNRDIFDVVRSIFGVRVVADVTDGDLSGSRRLVLDRLNRHREPDVMDSCVRLRALVER